VACESARDNSLETQISSLQCDAGSLESLIKLGCSHYPEGHPLLSKDFLQWLYLDNPNGPSTLIVAHEEALWIGLIALIPIVLECQGKIRNACFAVNVLTHPDHRTKNILVKMIKCARQVLAERGIWLLGHPNANSFPGFKRQKMNFRDPLHIFLAQINWVLPFKDVRNISSLEQLRGLPASFWESQTERSDTHVKYTPEFIEWRYLNAPHRKYVVSAVESRGKFLGLRVTRRFKGPVDLMVDFVAPIPMLGDILSSVRWPTLVLHPGSGSAANEIARGCWRLPFKRVIPFFVTTWDSSADGNDFSGITLAASDF
jgi:hypothetical protein